MADPLFFDTRKELLECMRLGSVCDDSSADPIIDRAIQLADVSLWQDLGTSTIALLQAQTYVDSVTSATQVARVQAQLLECTLVHIEIICLLPQMSIDGNGNGSGFYEEEAPFRLSGANDRDDLFDKLTAQAARLLSDLVADGSTGGVHSAIVGGACFDHTDPGNTSNDYVAAPLIGGSISRPHLDPWFPHERYRWSWNAGHFGVSSVPA